MQVLVERTMLHWQMGRRDREKPEQRVYGHRASPLLCLGTVAC